MRHAATHSSVRAVAAHKLTSSLRAAMRPTC
jgi:hypothetical protein